MFRDLFSEIWSMILRVLLYVLLGFLIYSSKYLLTVLFNFLRDPLDVLFKFLGNSLDDLYYYKWNTKYKKLKEVSKVKEIHLGAVAPFDGDAAKAVFGEKVNKDDLKLIEGIGPKIEKLFNKQGIKTWKALSEASFVKCKEVLISGGNRYKMHNPKTWAAQAKLAYEGKWEELLKWQDELDGGL